MIMEELREITLEELREMIEEINENTFLLVELGGVNNG